MIRAAFSAAIPAMLLLAAVPASAAPEDEVVVFDNGDIRGPNYDDSTTCAAVYMTAARVLGEADASYEKIRSNGVAWLGWSRMVAEDPDGAHSVMTRKMERMTAMQQSDGDTFVPALIETVGECERTRRRFKGEESFELMFMLQGI